jgi:hypothetical protein
MYFDKKLSLSSKSAVLIACPRPPVVGGLGGRACKRPFVFITSAAVVYLWDSRVRAPAIIIFIISGSACSTVGVHSQAWSTSGIGRLGSKSGRG